jgi:tetratricopeptide (TPR) repeat protein
MLRFDAAPRLPFRLTANSLVLTGFMAALALSPVRPGIAQTPSQTPPVGQPSAPALQSDAPGSPAEQTRVLGELYQQLAKATSPENADAIASAIQQLWSISGSDTVDLLMARTAMALNADDKPLALRLLDVCLKLSPNYAEAWNRRASIHFVAQDYIAALADLNRALAIDPNHFKALEGAALTLKEMGRKKLALEGYRRLIAVYPLSADGKRGLQELERDVEGQRI